MASIKQLNKVRPCSSIPMLEFILPPNITLKFINKSKSLSFLSLSEEKILSDNLLQNSI